MENKYQLPKEFAEKWVAALRSGEYEQGEGMLYDDFYGTYCCLGVAAKICDAPIDKIAKYSLLEIGGWFDEYGVPEALIGNNDTFIDSLTAMNDGFGTAKKSFPEIADWIEQNVEFI